MPLQNFRLPEMPSLKRIPGESDDERFERTTNQRRQQIDAMLDKLAVSQDERQFIIATAQRMVDLLCDDYSAARTFRNLTPECISAAATAAMIIVYDG
jgi:hypothetical protein